MGSRECVFAPLAAAATLHLLRHALASHTVRSAEEASLVDKHRELVAANKRLSAVDDFVVVSRNERQLASLSKQLAIVRDMRKAHHATVRTPELVSRVIMPLFYVMCYLLFGGAPVATLPQYWLFPLTYVLSIGEARHGDVSMLVWIVMCHFLGKALVAWAVLGYTGLRRKLKTD